MRLSSLFYGIITAVMITVSVKTAAQVKITDGSAVTVDPNSILELESSDKGLLIPRVAINNQFLPSPLTEPIPLGMLVFSSGGAVADGFYYWGSAGWINLSGTGTADTRIFQKSADDTLLKVSSIIFGSNDITLTLPQITASDTSLHIIVKNAGSHTDRLVIKGYGSATIDGMDDVEILPRMSKTFVAYGSNWVLLNRDLYSVDIINVGTDEQFQTLSDAFDYLKIHMDEPVVIRLGGETVFLSETQVIDLPFPVTIQGSTYGSGTIAPGPGLVGKPMFRCLTESYFKMLIFDATQLAGYGTAPNEDAIRLAGNGTYHEIKDCTFDSFFNAVVDSSDAELWMFECDISNAKNNGLLIESGLPGAKVRVSETDFILCKNGVNMSKGSSSEVQLMSGVYTTTAADNAILYNPAGFSFASLIITNNSCDNVGKGLVGFDFTRGDGRDANSYIENNPGFETSKPHCKINVTNNPSTITCSIANQWYKAGWTNTSATSTNFLIDNNKITYQPYTPRDIVIFISGNVLVNSLNRVITVGIVKNGNVAGRYGETAIRVTVANQPFQFSTVIYIEDVKQNDYFELYCASQNAGDVVRFQDINWYTNSE